MQTFSIFMLLLGLMALGLPVAVAMCLTSAATLLMIGQADILSVMGQRLYASTTSFPLLAIPFFILAAIS